MTKEKGTIDKSLKMVSVQIILAEMWTIWKLPVLSVYDVRERGFGCDTAHFMYDQKM